MKYRVGRKQNRVILDENGYKVAECLKGNEDVARQICALLNEHGLVDNLSQHLVSKRDFIKDDYVWFCGEINQVEAVKGNEVCIVELKGKLHQVVNKSELTNVR